MVACAAAFVSLWMASLAAWSSEKVFLLNLGSRIEDSDSKELNSILWNHKGHHYRLLEAAGPQVTYSEPLQTPCQNNYFGGSHVATDGTQKGHSYSGSSF